MKKVPIPEKLSVKNDLSNTRKSFVIVFGSYSNFNWIIKALIGAKFNIKFRFNDVKIYYH